MWIKIILGVVAGLVVWYVVRDRLIVLDEYIGKSKFGKKIEKRKESGFKFRDPLKR